ncbi:MAG: hypothetical protein RLZZ436_1049 [Planctomycetota bacterium]
MNSSSSSSSRLPSRRERRKYDHTLRPRHFVSRDDASIPDISVPAMISTTIRTPLVRILPPLLQNHLFSLENEGSEATLATHWTTHQGARQRTRRRSMCKHARAWTCRKAKQLAKNWENPGKTGFCSGEDRIRTTYKFPGKNRVSKMRRRKIRRAQLHLLVLKLYPEKMRLSRVAERTTIT